MKVQRYLRGDHRLEGDPRCRIAFHRVVVPDGYSSGDTAAKIRRMYIMRASPSLIILSVSLAFGRTISLRRVGKRKLNVERVEGSLLSREIPP